MKITLLPATAQGENKIGWFNYDQERVPRENALLLEANCVCSSNMPATAKTKIFRSEKEPRGNTDPNIFCNEKQRGHWCSLNIFKVLHLKGIKALSLQYGPQTFGKTAKAERSFSPSLHPSLLKQVIKPGKNLWPSPLRHAVKPRWPSPEAGHKPFIPNSPSLCLEEVWLSLSSHGPEGESELAGLFKAPSLLLLGPIPWSHLFCMCKYFFIWSRNFHSLLLLWVLFLTLPYQMTSYGLLNCPVP